MQVFMALELVADAPIDDRFETFIGWAIPAKGSISDSYVLYEGGVLKYDSTQDPTLASPLSLYQTVTVTPNGLRPSRVTRETILANIAGAD